MNGLLNQIHSIRIISKGMSARVGKNNVRSIHIAAASCLGNSVIGLGKLLIGLLSLSFFTSASALYTFGMVTAKAFVLAGIVKEEDSKAQYSYYKKAGLILIGSSILYIIYSIHLIISPVNASYSKFVAMSIGTFTFAEIVLNVRGVIRERHNHKPLVHALKMINLASSLMCLVLTQAALLSFASDKFETHAYATGATGVIMGTAATILGIIMIVRYTRIRDQKINAKY